LRGHLVYVLVNQRPCGIEILGIQYLVFQALSSDLAGKNEQRYCEQWPRHFPFQASLVQTGRTSPGIVTISVHLFSLALIPVAFTGVWGIHS
jgi:hypothetical protein